MRAAVRRPRRAQAARPRLDPRPARGGPRPAQGRPRARLRDHRASIGGAGLHRLAAPHRRARADARRPRAEWGCSTTTGSSRAAREEEVNAGCASRGGRAPAAGARARRAARPLADDVARVPAARRSSTPSRSPPAAACTATSTATPASCAPSWPSATASPQERLVVGDGAAQLLERGRAARCSSPTTSSSRRGRPIRCTRSWPGARAATRCPSPASASSACSRAVNERTRLVALCNPNDPTGELLRRERARRAARARCPSASSSCSTRRCATSSTPSRATPRSRCSSDHPAPARLPHLLEGLGPGRPALRLRDRRPGRRAAARAARARARRSTSWRRPARWRRCAPRAASSPARGRASPPSARAADGGAARARRRGRAEPGQRPVAARRRASTARSSRTRLERQGVIVAPGRPAGRARPRARRGPRPGGVRPPPQSASPRDRAVGGRRSRVARDHAHRRRDRHLHRPARARLPGAAPVAPSPSRA